MSNAKSKLEANLIILERHRDLIDAYIASNKNRLENENYVISENVTLEVTTFRFY